MVNILSRFKAMEISTENNPELIGKIKIWLNDEPVEHTTVWALVPKEEGVTMYGKVRMWVLNEEEGPRFKQEDGELLTEEKSGWVRWAWKEQQGEV